MTNIVPGVHWQPINVGARAKRRKGRGLCGHVAVSTSKNLVPGPNADWHFYLPKSGPAIQYIDLDLQCWATGAGNATMAAFESEGGMGTEAQVNAEPWTDNQIEWAARILAHMHLTEGVPLRAMISSAPTERGFGTHRLGVPGYMTPGTEQWSSSRGKSCPGTAKHNQRFAIVERAKQIASGTAAGKTPAPEEDDLSDPAIVNAIRQTEQMAQAILRQLGLDKNLKPGPDYGKVTVPGWAQLGLDDKGRPLTLVDAFARMKADIEDIKARLDADPAA